MKEATIREQVHKQREFYIQAFEYAVLNSAIILAWLLFDFGATFWPKYVILVSLLALGVKGYAAGLFPFFATKLDSVQSQFHFMSKEWEEEKVKELMGQGPETKPKSPKKPAQKKVVGRTKKPI